MKKRIICRTTCALLLAAVMTALSLTGCTKTAGRAGADSGSKPADEHRLRVVTTVFPQYDFARHIAGDSADVTMLLKPGEEIHSYEPTPLDIKMIQNSDLFIYIGGENDVWVDNILNSVGDDGPEAVRLLDLVDTYTEEHLEGMMPEKGGHDHAHEAGEESTEDHDHEHGAEAESGEDHEHEHDYGAEAESGEDHEHEHGAEAESGEDHEHDHEEEPDEHVWTSPENCVTLIGKLTDVFCEADPANEAVYRANGDAYRAEFEELDAQYRRMAASAERKTILFGDRFPFRYLAEELGLTCYAAFSGCSAESEPSAATIAFLIDKAAEEKLPVVFKIEFSNGNIASAISEAAMLRVKRQKERGEEAPVMQVLQLHSCHNLTRDEFAAGETCLSLMTKNLEGLRTALGAPAP